MDTRQATQIHGAETNINITKEGQTMRRSKKARRARKNRVAFLYRRRQLTKANKSDRTQVS